MSASLPPICAKLRTSRLEETVTVVIILATANTRGATRWTQDKDFESIEGVKYIAKIH